jgi:hypothetical protein
MMVLLHYYECYINNIKFEDVFLKCQSNIAILYGIEQSSGMIVFL